MSVLENYTFADPSIVQNPYLYFELMREHDPVHKDETIKTWLVTRYDDIVSVAHDTETFSDEIKVTDEVRSPHYLEAVQRISDAGLSMNVEASLKVDGELHRRRRGLVAHAFSPPVVAKLNHRVVDICRSKVAAFDRSGEVDLVGQFASLIPVEVIATTLGLPEDRMEDIRLGADSMIAHSFGGARTREEALWHADNLITLLRFAKETIEDRRINPGEDLISYLVNPEVNPTAGELTHDELMSTASTSIAGGVDTTRNGIANAMLALTVQKGLFERIKNSAEQDKDIDRLCEESLRYHTPVPMLPRMVNVDTELCGKQLKKGEILFLCWASGNRDSSMFEDPDSFDIDRKNARRHLTFGTGVHHCLGAVLARNEIKTAIRTFVDAVDSIELAIPESELDYSDSVVMMRTLKSLPVKLKFTAA